MILKYWEFKVWIIDKNTTLREKLIYEMVLVFVNIDDKNI